MSLFGKVVRNLRMQTTCHQMLLATRKKLHGALFDYFYLFTIKFILMEIATFLNGGFGSGTPILKAVQNY